MADLSKLRFNGTDYNVKDASAPKRKFDNTYAKTGNLPITSDDTIQSAIGKLENNMTPKSNLVDVVDNGAKNHATINSGSYTATSDGKYARIPLEPITGTIVIDFGTLSTSHSTPVTCAVELKDSSGSYITSFNLTPGSNIRHELTISGTATLLTIYPAADWATTDYGDTVTWSNLMVTTKALHLISDEYEPYALGNQILTPAVIQKVDEGAKNKWDFANCGNGNWHATTSKTDTSFTITSTGIRAYFTMWQSLPAGRYVFSAKISNLSGPDYKGISIRASSAGGTSLGYDITFSAGGTISGEFTCTATTTVYFVCYAAMDSFTGATSYTASDIMVCTLADWKVSQKFAPYRPNWDLVKNILSERTASLSKVTVTVNTDYTLISGLSYTTTASAITRITAILMNGSSTPVGIIISKSNQASLYNNAANLMAKYEIETTDERKQLEVSCTVQDSTAITYYVWAKSKTSASNIVKIIGEIIG